MERQNAKQGDLLAFGAVIPEITKMRVGLLVEIRFFLLGYGLFAEIELSNPKYSDL